jgi:RNA polymerase sigma factor (sigma-70 family)
VAINGRRVDAEDFAQEVWVRLHYNFAHGRYVEKQQFPQYVRAIAFRRYCKWMKVKRNRKLNGYLLKMSMEQPDHTLPYNISYKKLYYCLGKLPEKTQFILVLHFWRKMTFQAVAVEIGDSLTSVTSAADRGYQNMYDLLNRKSPF